MATDGPLEVDAYVCPEKGAKLELKKVTLPPLKATQVECDMLMCGLCHTDIHMKDNDWGVTNYPLVAGHEGVGIVRKLGDCVRNLKVGDRVAIGWCRDSCLACDACQAGRENICRKGYQGLFLCSNAGCWGKSELKYNEHGGAFSKVMRIEERFAIKIPDAVPSELAAPLACGGGTVYEPIKNYCKAGTKLGVAGIGGLGTCAIKLAKLGGCIVTAISSTAGKKTAALSSGADSFVCLQDAAAMEAAAASLDVIIDTSPANSDPATYLNLVKFDGVYCRVGIPPAEDHEFKYQYIPLIFTQKSIAGSIITGTLHMNEMMSLVADNMEFMGKENPEWNVEVVPFDQINETMDKLLKRENKGFRYVLKW